MKPATKAPNGHGSLYKEVRFSPTATPIRRTQSVSTSNPASKPDSVRILGTSYIDHSRSLLDRQRIAFENERAFFAEERELWEQERELLRLKIAELESKLKNKPEAGSSTKTDDDDAALVQQGSDPGTSHLQVWEGSSPALRPTRVFLEEQSDNASPSQFPPLVGEQGGQNMPVPHSLDAALSPRSHATDPSASSSVPVPIEKLDSSLDGITLKSTALPPEIVARVMTPPSPSPMEMTTSSSTSHRPGLEHRNSLKLKLSELGPPDRNRTRDAGHTPMAVIDTPDPEIITEKTSPGTGEENPLAPVATEVRQPVENSESYFPDPPDDPSLKGPLSLLNEKEHDSSFLKELDQRLLDEAKHVLSTKTAVSGDSGNKAADVDRPNQGEAEPELKFKNTTNFGSAFGLSNPGGF